MTDRAGACCEYHAAPYVTASGVSQTILADPALNEIGVYGNCLQAAVATMLGLHLDAVPHFAAFEFYDEALRLWMRGRGLGVVRQPVSEVPLDDWCLIGGLSPRGVKHVVVASEGHIYWDPHPSRAGLTAIETAWRFPDLTTAEAVGGYDPGELVARLGGSFVERPIAHRDQPPSTDGAS